MAVFDAEVFTNVILADVRECIDKMEGNTSQLREEVRQLHMDIEAELAALEVERDSRRAQALRDDLIRILPIRKGEIIAASENGSAENPGPAGDVRLFGDLRIHLETACKAILAVSKAFVVGGL